MRSSSFYASYQTQHQAKGKAKARLMPLRIAHRRSAAPKTKDRRTRATTTRREARREAAAGRCSSSGLPRSGSSTPMESSPTRSSSSSLSLPPSPSDRQGRLTTTQLEQLRVEQEVYGIYRLFHGVAPHTRSFISFHLREIGNCGAFWCSRFIDEKMDKNGGYGGGPGQMPHLATTYAAVNTLITLGSEMSLSSIHRENMLKFLLQMKDSSGAFRMHNGGEIDVRACYTAISVASILNVLDDELVTDLGNYILSCQTYEGGIAGEPGSEAHGGYTFCGLATMILINEVDKLDLPSLVGKLAKMKTYAELGLLILIMKVLEGGFRDKPGKQRDFYHSCYCLSGLSVSQYSWSKDDGEPPLTSAVLGPYTNLLEPVHPLYNVVLHKYYKSHEFFSTL
ncbi:protein farnesyltransferase subunit [Musa troglodytarum]|uniref:Protein farnesyltransferase subunit n=1 Tax=Musa troglodytarum TaxID=320322 RepID=A0A9E7L4D2_9LILI|nr:protein farnesyltransferase subunit [Musa troglodytarum]